MDETGELEMLEDAFTEAIEGVTYTEAGDPQIVYSGPMLMELHMVFGFSESEAYEEIDAFRGSSINVMWPCNIEVKPDRPPLTLIRGKKDLH